MKQFCEEVLKFLRSEYNYTYQFEIKHQLNKPTNFLPTSAEVVLTITVSHGYKIVVTNDSMQYIFSWYVNGEFIKERNQYRWQKELIDMIEGS